MDLTLAGVTLHVADVDRSLAFYQQVPGVQVMFHMPGRFALLRFGTGRLALLSDRKRPFHVELDCDDLDATYTKFKELEIHTEGPPTLRLWGERDFFVLDPDGNLVQVGQRRALPSSKP